MEGETTNSNKLDKSYEEILISDKVKDIYDNIEESCEKILTEHINDRNLSESNRKSTMLEILYDLL